MLTPLTSTPSLARMRMYRVPSIMRVSHQVAALRVDVDGDVGECGPPAAWGPPDCGGSGRPPGRRPGHTGPQRHPHGGAATPQEDRTDRTSPFGEQEGLLLLAGLVLFDHVPQLAVDGLDHVIAAILRQRLPQEGLKGLLLDGGRHGRRGAEQGVNELQVVLPDVPGVVEGIIEVGGALVKGGEEEACLRRRRPSPPSGRGRHFHRQSSSGRAWSASPGRWSTGCRRTPGRRRRPSAPPSLAR